MHGFRLLGAPLGACVVLAAANAAAQPQAPLIDCWDGTFAYTMVGLRPADAGYELLVTTQDERLFSPLFPDVALDWGQAGVTVVFAPEACIVDAERRLFSCRADEVELTLTMGELSGSPGLSVSKTPRWFGIELVDIMRAGGTESPPPTKFLLAAGLIDGQNVDLSVAFDFPEYCDGTWSAFESQ